MFVSLSSVSTGLQLDGGMPLKKCSLNTSLKGFGIAEVSCVLNAEQTSAYVSNGALLKPQIYTKAKLGNNMA